MPLEVTPAIGSENIAATQSLRRLYLDSFYLFLGQPIKPAARVVLMALAVPLAVSLSQPLWRISMEAAQYPNACT